jgi:hypothetical protein
MGEPRVGFGDAAIDPPINGPVGVARDPLLRRFHQCFEFAARNNWNHLQFCQAFCAPRYKIKCLYGRNDWCLPDDHSVEFTSIGKK